MEKFTVNKTLTATFTYIDLVRLASGLELKLVQEKKDYGDGFEGSKDLLARLEEMLDAVR
jgi:hypothetical protein